LDIFIIIFGAIFFLEILRHQKIIDNISYYLESFSKDYRIQIILLAWFLENFLEGTAGFGTPSTVVAPLLIGLGLSPFKAVVIALLGNSASVVFGGAGTPIRVGMAGLETSAVPWLAAAINCIGLIVPIMMLNVMTTGAKNKREQFWPALPFAIWSGIAFVLPSLFIALWLGPEFPSILGSIIGLILIIITTRLGIFMPKQTHSLSAKKIPIHNLSWFKTILPYVLLILFLVAGKIWLSGVNILIPLGINHNFNLFNPGFAFILAGLVTLFREKNQKEIIGNSIKIAIKGAIEPFLVIAVMSAIVQIMINSGNNLSGWPSSIALIAKIFENSLLPLLAPIAGAFGSFITGSATIANIMFGKLLSDTAQLLNINTAKILALTLVGGAAGNMVALADMLAAEAVAGLRHQERSLLQNLIGPCLIYVFLAGLVGLIIT